MEMRNRSLSKAFELLRNDDDYVDLYTFEQVMGFVDRASNLLPEQIRFVYHMLDKDHDQQLSNNIHITHADESEFMYICEVMQFTFEKIGKTSELPQYRFTIFSVPQKYLDIIFSHRQVISSFIDMQLLDPF